MTTWIHQRKGRMTGEIIKTSADGEWVEIRLTEDARSYNAGEEITVRWDFMTELHDD